MKKVHIIFIGLIIGLVILFNAAFTVHQTQQALVLQFGEPKRTITEPGLAFRIPFIQEIAYLEKRLLDYDARPEELILGDEKRLVVDTVTRFRIVDPLLYYQSTRDEAVLRARLQDFITASLRSTLGKYGLSDLLSSKRSTIMKQVGESANNKSKNLGVQIVDILIKRADLPEQNTEAVLGRMQKERERIAMQFRAEGRQEAQEIRSEADRLRTVILAEAERDGQIARGEGDRTANEIYAAAYSVDQEFFQFYRSMQAYKKALKDDQTSLVLSPDSDFFKFFTPKGQQQKNTNIVNDKEALKKIQQKNTFIEQLIEKNLKNREQAE